VRGRLGCRETPARAGRGSRAAIIGSLQTRIKATGKTTAAQFAIILTITGDGVTRFQMLEDSFDVSKAADAQPAHGSGRCGSLLLYRGGLALPGPST
jgi:hypothetical protein